MARTGRTNRDKILDLLGIMLLILVFIMMWAPHFVEREEVKQEAVKLEIVTMPMTYTAIMTGYNDIENLSDMVLSEGNGLYATIIIEPYRYYLPMMYKNAKSRR